VCQIPLKVTFLMPVSLRTGFILLALNKFELTGMYVRTNVPMRNCQKIRVCELL